MLPDKLNEDFTTDLIQFLWETQDLEYTDLDPIAKEIQRRYNEHADLVQSRSDLLQSLIELNAAIDGFFNAEGSDIDYVAHMETINAAQAKASETIKAATV